MNMHVINLIIGREYKTRVKKKSFLIITFLGPILFAAMCILPTVIMMGAKEQAKTVAVVDKSGIVVPTLEDSKTIRFVDFSMLEVDTLKANMKDMELDVVLSISALDEATKSVAAESFSEKPLGMETSEIISNKINDAIQKFRVDSYGIENLSAIMDDVKPNIRLKSYTLDAEGKETISESGVYMLVSMLLGMIIYMFIAMFCGSVMSSVIEEKSSRVVEVLVSSVKATELMFGKIIGVALVALTQFMLWIVLTAAIVGVVSGIMGKNLLSQAGGDPMAMVESMGVSTDQLDAAGMNMNVSDLMAQAEDEDGGFAAAIETVKNLPIAQILVAFVLFFIFGYLLYASLFAAIGSAVENEGDTQQLQIPVTIPLLLGFFIALYAYKAPDSALVLWGSMIPFTSPIVMLARIPFGVPVWQLALSIALLVGTFVLCAYLSARIYKVGILMFGKKSSWKDLLRWIRQ
ncbi:MAG: ABC transporter permease [Bacteroidales bacterium]|nr:ABC transporter permease [Candidatus Cryptobacteroides onthequi]MCQ2165073.1 ABC transporter permease [Bacteroidales bacterium]